MELSDEDYSIVKEELGREPNRVEEALFVNLWSEHCAYRSSRMFLADLPNESEDVVIGPGDDAAVVDFDEDKVLAVGMESHNHPSYVDPYDGAATGVGGIVRDILSMGARPISLMDTIYFGDFEMEKNRYLFEGVVEGIADYGNSIGVPTVGGQTYFDESYNGNPLVNVVCIGLAPRDRIVTAGLKNSGNKLVLVGSSTGRDGLGGASFASDDLSEDAESEDRPAVQVGDPYTEKLLIDASLEIVEHAEAARDLGAAGLAGASSEMAEKTGRGAEIHLDEVHLREEGMNGLEILLSESQERMMFEVKPEDVEKVEKIADKYDLESSVVGEVTDTGRYVAKFEGETIVDLPAEFLAEGAPDNDLDMEPPSEGELEHDYELTKEDVLEVLSDPTNASKEWVYRQYDHEVQTRTVVKPGDDSAVLNIDGKGLALSSGCDSRRVKVNPRKGGGEVVYENALNIAAKGGRPVALVNCLNFGNPEKPDRYGEFAETIAGMGDMAEELGVPIVGGNVSLYNESEEFGTAVNPTPSVGMLGTTPKPDAPRAEFSRRGDSVLLLNAVDESPSEVIETLRHAVLDAPVSASHDVSEGGLVVALAEMFDRGEYGASISTDIDVFDESYGRVILTTDSPEEVKEALKPFEVLEIGEVVESGLEIKSEGREVQLSGEEIKEARSSLSDAM